MKTTLVIGASTDPHRYAHIAILKLRQNNYPVIALGLDEGKVGDVEIVHQWNPQWKVDTVTLYLNPTRQQQYYQQLIDLKPNRVIFNPGTENEEFMRMLARNNIDFIEACTLVLLSIDEY